MLTVHQLSKNYGIKPILKNITFTINAGERVGLIGPNGSGKTTLLRIIAGHENANSGTITTNPPTLQIGYLTQGFEPPPSLTLPELLHQTIGSPELLEQELTSLAEQMAVNPEDTAVQQAYDKTLAKLSRLNISQIEATLASLELHHIPPDQPIGTLSGGQKTRLNLAIVLLQQPDLLLLDEPTNHLDITMLEWLEQWLNTFPGGVLIVSHDRTFLNQTVTRILDLDPHTQTIQEYTGNYTDYLEQYLQAREKQWAAYKDQVYEIRRMKQDIARTREQANSVERSTTPRQPGVRRIAKKVMKKAKSREKKLERYLESDERVDKPTRSWQMKLDLANQSHLGKDVLFLDDLTIGYANHPPLVSHLTMHIQSGERIILTGANGSGKSTLLRTITGQLPPLSGTFRLGGSVQMGYMSQEQDLLAPEMTPLTTIQSVAQMNETEARSYLHYFLFSGDDALLANHLLSFGQRARLALARLVAQGCNFLLLDEPINHLDIPSRTQFEEALSQFEGTVLAVVHDRYFIERFAQKVWWLENGRIRVTSR
jgi:ATP-binding cassette subfamily F protein 3